MHLGFEFTSKFIRQYDRKTSDERERVEKALELLATNPRHPGLHSHKIQGAFGIFECYIDDSHRVTYEYSKNCIVLRNNCSHNIIDRNP
jgi:mRNA-degrading endonuclease YafQ of YafQ-DinJ toxin-antitoxin module